MAKGLLKSTKKETRTKKSSYTDLIGKYEKNVKKTWQLIKEIIDNKKCLNNSPPERITMKKN